MFNSNHTLRSAKKAAKWLCLMLATLMLIPTMLVGCQPPEDPTPEQPPEDNPPTTTPVPLINEDGSYAFQIIRPDNCSQDVQDSAVAISAAFKAIYGKGPKVGNDYVDRNGVADHPEMEVEILVGPTNRPESVELAKELGTEEYLIRVVNNKVVIVGKNDFCVKVAANYFIETYLKGSTIHVPNNLNYLGVCDFMYTFTIPKTGIVIPCFSNAESTAFT